MLKKVGKIALGTSVVFNILSSCCGCAYQFVNGNVLVNKEGMQEFANKFIEIRKGLVDFWKNNEVKILKDGNIRVEDTKNAPLELDDLSAFVNIYYGEYVSAFDKLLESIICYDGDQFAFVNGNNLKVVDEIFEEKKVGFNFSDVILKDPFLLAVFSLAESSEGKELFNYKFGSLKMIPEKEGCCVKKIERTFQDICSRYYHLIENFQVLGSVNSIQFEEEWLTKVKEFDKNLVEFYSNKSGGVENKKITNEKEKNNANKEKGHNVANNDDGNNQYFDGYLACLVKDFLKSRKELLTFVKNTPITFLDGKVRVFSKNLWTAWGKYSLKEFFSKFFSKYFGTLDSIVEYLAIYCNEDTLGEEFDRIDLENLACIDGFLLKELGFSFSSFVKCFYKEEYLLSCIFSFMYLDKESTLSSVEVSSLSAMSGAYSKGEVKKRKMIRIFKRFRELYQNIRYKEDRGATSVPENELIALKSKSELGIQKSMTRFFESLCKGFGIKLGEFEDCIAYLGQYEINLSLKMKNAEIYGCGLDEDWYVDEKFC